MNTLPEVLDDPHFRQRGIVMTDARGWDHIGNPIRFAGEPGRERLVPPALGQHSHAILRDIGYSESDIAKLREEGAISEATADEVARHGGLEESVSTRNWRAVFVLDSRDPCSFPASRQVAVV